MSYQEALKEIISRQRAISFVKDHGVILDEFFAEVGDKEEYTGKEVLDWLGY